MVVLPSSGTINLMKLSVSVPDDLWDEARSLAADAGSSSAVVQEALRRWVVQQRQRPAYATGPPDEVLDDLREAHDRLVQEAKAEFQHGYTQGVQCARRLPWEAIESLADIYNFNISEWASGWANAAVELDMAQPPLSKEKQRELLDAWLRNPRRPRPFDWAAVDAGMQLTDAMPSPYVVVRALVPALGQLVPPYGDNVEFTPKTTYLRGFTRAMRDIWSSVAEGTTANGG
jgi:hypothetical protein